MGECMVRVLSRSLALIGAVALVGVSTLALASSLTVVHDTVAVLCFCDWVVYPDWQAAHAWNTLLANRFTVRAPSGTVLANDDDYAGRHGRIVHPAFALNWQSGATDGTASWRTLPSYSEAAINLAGAEAVIRRAYQPGSDKPFRLAMIVPGLRAADELVFEGAYATAEQRDMAEAVLRSVVVYPQFDAPVVPPPTIEVETP
jgi:hypothetical protein